MSCLLRNDLFSWILIGRNTVNNKSKKLRLSSCDDHFLQIIIFSIFKSRNSDFWRKVAVDIPFHGSLSQFPVCGLTQPCPCHQREWRTWCEAWPLYIVMVDWEKPESTCPCREVKDCRVQAMTIYSLCAHGWPLVDSRFHSWNLHTTHSALSQRRDRKRGERVYEKKFRLLTYLHLELKKKIKKVCFPLENHQCECVMFCEGMSIDTFIWGLSLENNFSHFSACVVRDKTKNMFTSAFFSFA